MSSLANISVTCFAASYFVAWLLEVSRLFFRSGVRGAVMIGFAAAGLVAHTLFLASRAWNGPQPALSSSFDWCLLTAWVLVVAYLYLTYFFPRAGIGIFMLPLILGLILAAAVWADEIPSASGSAARLWGAIHGVFLLMGTVAVMVGFVAGLMYLLQSYRLKHKMLGQGPFRFPSLEWLEKINARVIFVSTLMVGGGFLSGIVLKMVRDRHLRDMPWTDPVIWSSALMLGWLLAASIFSAAYRPARQGQKVAYLTVASFIFLAFALGVLLLGNTGHGHPQRAASYLARPPLSSDAMADEFLKSTSPIGHAFTEVLR